MGRGKRRCARARRRSATPEELEAKLKILIPELLELNAHLLDGDAPPRQARTHFSAFEREVQFA